MKTMDAVIVYDREYVSERIAQTLSNGKSVNICGYAHTKEEALHLVSTAHPQLVIIDVELADHSGVEVLRQLKTAPHPPVVIMTSETPSFQYRKVCKRDGADYYFQLPEQATEFRDVAFDLAARCAAQGLSMIQPDAGRITFWHAAKE
jgi:DNA-binding NarL/FixJ family response regulator